MLKKGFKILKIIIYKLIDYLIELLTVKHHYLINFTIPFFLATLNMNELIANSIKVPTRIYFCKTQIKLSKEIKTKVQAKVDQLTRWKYQENTDKLNLFTPIFSKILKKENLPQDLIFIAMHESGLVPNRKGKISEDYGIWQINDYAKVEEEQKKLGIRIDNIIDERMHIIHATHAMAKIMKRNYDHFQNWVYTILAYNMGQTGLQEYIKLHNCKFAIKKNKKFISLGIKTPDYILYVLAYYIAFKRVLGKTTHPTHKIHVHKVTKCKDLNEIANIYKIPPTLLDEYQKYNAWLKCPNIPSDKEYHVIVPLSHTGKHKIARNLVGGKKNPKLYNITASKQYKDKFHIYKIDGQKFPIIQLKGGITYINGIKGHIPKQKMSIEKLSRIGNITIEELCQYNDIGKEHKIIKNFFYYFEPKKNKGGIRYYIAGNNDTWWKVSQKYGIKKSELLIKNERSKIEKTRFIEKNRLIFLRFIRPKHYQIEYIM